MILLVTAMLSLVVNSIESDFSASWDLNKVDHGVEKSQQITQPRPLSPTLGPRVGEAPIPCSAQTNCHLPNCYCDAEKIPGGLAVTETPQIVMVTFDDAVNGENIALINRFFQPNRTNPNGCPITGTFFVSNDWTDYRLVGDLYQKGHEIASHSIKYDKSQRKVAII